MRHGWPLLLGALFMVAGPGATEAASVDVLPDEIVERIFGYATGAGLEKYPGWQQFPAWKRGALAQLDQRSYTAIGTLLMRWEQVEVALEYFGPSPETHKSLLLSLQAKDAASANWVFRQVPAVGMGNVLKALAKEAFFHGMNHANPMRPSSPYYLLTVRTADKTVEHFEVLPIEPGKNDDPKTGHSRPDTVRKVKWIRHEVMGVADAFDDLLAPLLPLKLTVSMEETTGPVSISAELQNIGNTNISVGVLRTRTPFVACTALDSKNQVVTFEHRVKLQASAPAPSDFTILKPGQSQTASLEFASAEAVKLVPAGPYQVSCWYYGRDGGYSRRTTKSNAMTFKKNPFPWGGVVKSNTVTFTVSH